MNILILGSTGFIGKNLVTRLKKENYNVFTCERASGVDIRDYKQIYDKIAEVKPEVIYNLASHGGSLHYVKEYSADVFNDNVQMALNLYRAVQEVSPTTKIIQPFSNCSYPGSSDVQTESTWLDGPVHPSVMSFGTSKRTIYYLSQCYYNQYGIRSVNLLFPNTYGPGDSCDPNKTHALNGMVIRMLEAKENNAEKFVVWGTGAPIREWAYVSDFVEVLVLAMDLEVMIYPLNMGQGRGYSIAESALLIQCASGYTGEIVFDTQYTDGDPIKILDSQKFEETFPEFVFYDHYLGIEKTVEYYVSHRD
tara:strand:+ start:1390 stop:2310 length:921 start_codon:yes stop_codon:yes gene_type:complete